MFDLGHQRQASVQSQGLSHTTGSIPTTRKQDLVFENNAQAGLLMQMFITYAQGQRTDPHHHPARPRRPDAFHPKDDRAFCIRPVQHEGRAGKKASGTARQSPRARRDASTLQAVVRNAAHTRPRAHRSRERAWTIQTLFSTTDQQPPRRCNHLQSATSRERYQIQTDPGGAKFLDSAAVQIWCLFN